MQISTARSGLPASHYASGFHISTVSRAVDLALLIVKHAWSPSIFRDGVRLKSNYEYSDMCALDFDSPETPLKQALNVFSDMQCIVGTTKSHQKEKNGVVCDRYRVVMPWEERIRDCGVYEYNIGRVIAKYEADSACVDGARFFFPCTEIVCINFDGYTMEVEEKAKPRVNVETYKQAGKEMRIPSFLEAMIRSPIAAGQRNRTVWEMAFKLALCDVPVAKIESLIFSNPTCQNTSADFTEKEILDTIAKGVMTAREKNGPQQFEGPPEGR